jgi:hypothetical protein
VVNRGVKTVKALQRRGMAQVRAQIPGQGARV